MNKLILVTISSFLLWSHFAQARVPSYDDFFPYSVEVCGLSKETVGNSWGHAVIYLKGVCRVRNWASVKSANSGEIAPWRVKVCAENDPSEDASVGDPSIDLEKGVLLSVNAKVSNSHWIAIPGKNLAMSGGLPLDERVDTAQTQAIWSRILASQAYDGLKLRPSSQVQFEKDLEKSVEEFLIAEGFGTDFAVTLARNAKCWRIPVNQKQMKAMVDYANRINEEPYRWNFLSSNCNHLVVGVLAAAKILKPVEPGMWNLLHLPRILPTDTLVRIAKYAKGEIPTVEKVFKKQRFRESLLEFGRLPVEFSNLWETIPFRREGNLAFVEHHRRWGWFGEHQRILTMDHDRSLTDLDASLEDYGNRLERAQARLDSMSLEDRLRRVSKSDRAEFAHVFNLYRGWLKETTERVGALMLYRQSSLFHSLGIPVGPWRR